MATVTLSPQLIASFESCIDDCAEELAEEIGSVWHDVARATAPTGTHHKARDGRRYKNSFTNPATRGGNGTYVTSMDNTARHASFVEEGSGPWAGARGKYYRFDPPAHGVIQDWYWGAGGNDGPFIHPGTEPQEIVCDALRTAVRSVS